MNPVATDLACGQAIARCGIAQDAIAQFVLPQLETVVLTVPHSPFIRRLTFLTRRYTKHLQKSIDGIPAAKNRQLAFAGT